VSDLYQVVESLKQGGLIAYPTEGVWGMGCDPANKKAVDNLLSLKGRSVKKGLILIGSEMEHFKPYAELEQFESLLFTKWPGPHTWVVPASSAPEWLTGGKQSIALRMSDHEPVKNLCRNFKSALVSTSANSSGALPAKTEEEIQEMYPGVTVYSESLGDFKGPTPIQDILSEEMIRGS